MPSESTHQFLGQSWFIALPKDFLEVLVLKSRLAVNVSQELSKALIIFHLTATRQDIQGGMKGILEQAFGLLAQQSAIDSDIGTSPYPVPKP